MRKTDGVGEMQERNDRRIRRMLATALLLCAGILSNAQSNDAGQGLPDPPTPAARSIEDLNYLGGDAAMPPFSDSVIDVDSGFHRSLFSKGIAFRVITGIQYTHLRVPSSGLPVCTRSGNLHGQA